jgi:plasmid stabilization system protein ParE
MMRKNVLKSTFLASACMAAALATGTASAQLGGMPNPGAIAGTAVLGPALLDAHKTDLEALAGDLARVQTPAAAKEYEQYLASQLPKYVQNHKNLHHVALPGFRKVKAGGAAAAQQQAIADAADKLSETHFPRIAADMERVEKLNPGLKKHFDVLRTLD